MYVIMTKDFLKEVDTNVTSATYFCATNYLRSNFNNPYDFACKESNKDPPLVLDC